MIKEEEEEEAVLWYDFLGFILTKRRKRSSAFVWFSFIVLSRPTGQLRKE